MAEEMKPTTAEAAQFLKGIDFPADKSKIVQYAQSHKAPESLIDVLQNMPETSYESMADVFQGFGQAK